MHLILIALPKGSQKSTIYAEQGPRDTQWAAHRTRDRVRVFRTPTKNVPLRLGHVEPDGCQGYWLCSIEIEADII